MNDLRSELYLALLLLGADRMLLAALASWQEGTEDKDVLADVRNWNEAKVLELKEWLSTMTGEELESVRRRIEEYEHARRALKLAA